MNKHKLRFQLKCAAINLVPSAIIFTIIVSGAALHVSWFELSWSNDVLFVLLALAGLLPLTKLPLLFLNVQDPPFWQFGAWAGASAQERAAQIELLEEHLKDPSLAVGATTR